MSPPPPVSSRLRALLQLDFSIDPAIGAPLLLGGGPPRVESGIGQRQGESLLPFGAAAPGTHAPGTDRASQAAVASWELAHGIGNGGGVSTTSDLVAEPRAPVPGRVSPSKPSLAAPSRGGSGSAHTSPTVIALAASALCLALVVALVVGGLAARGLATWRRKEEEEEADTAGAGAPSPSPTSTAAGPAWWQRLTVAGPAAVAPFSGEDSALATPAGIGGGPPTMTSVEAAAAAAAASGSNLSPGIARRLVSVDDSAYGEEGGAVSAAATPVQPPSRFSSFFSSGSGRAGVGGDPEAGGGGV
jgi:hypothetical protein